MARHFTVTLTSGTNIGPYTIYHTSSTNGNQALLYGTSNQATNLTLAQVQGGVLITVPDNATSVIFYNTNGLLIKNCPTNIVEYPLTPSGTPVATPQPTPDATPVATPQPTPLPTNGATPQPTPNPSATPNVTQMPTYTPTPIPSATPSPSPSATPNCDFDIDIDIATPEPTPEPTPTPTTEPATDCNCIEVSVQNSYLTNGSNEDLYYINNDCGEGQTSLNLKSEFAMENGDSSIFYFCSGPTISNMFKYGPSGNAFISQFATVSSNGSPCNNNFDCRVL